MDATAKPEGFLQAVGVPFFFHVLVAGFLAFKVLPVLQSVATDFNSGADSDLVKIIRGVQGVNVLLVLNLILAFILWRRPGFRRYFSFVCFALLFSGVVALILLTFVPTFVLGPAD